MTDITKQLLAKAEKDVKEKFANLGKGVTYEEYVTSLNRYNAINTSSSMTDLQELLSNLLNRIDE